MRFFKQKNKLFPNRKSVPRTDKYLNIVYCNKAGKTLSIRMHKYVPAGILTGFILCAIGLVSLGVYSSHLNHSLVKSERLNHTNHALRSEVEALSSKIHTIETTMGQLKNLSVKIKKTATRDDDRNINLARDTAMDDYQGADTLGIGPLSKEEYEISKKLTGIKEEHLQLKSLFEEADHSQLESAEDLAQFTTLMATLKNQNKKLQLIPDVAPTRGHLSSTFGWRTSPFSGKGKMHMGLDIAAPLGSPIYATADGVVVRTAVRDDYGRMLEIQHSDKLLTRYGHTSMVYVKEGQHVRKGQIIAAVGTTGRSTGPHVHYEIEVNGHRTDPKKYIVLW